MPSDHHVCTAFAKAGAVSRCRRTAPRRQQPASRGQRSRSSTSPASESIFGIVQVRKWVWACVRAGGWSVGPSDGCAIVGVSLHASARPCTRVYLCGSRQFICQNCHGDGLQQLRRGRASGSVRSVRRLASHRRHSTTTTARTAHSRSVFSAGPARRGCMRERVVRE